MTQKNAQGPERDRVIKIAFGFMAITCLLAGFILYVFAQDLGFDQETARLVAIAFLVAGALDYIVLRFWDRLKPKR